jgi:Zn-dependent alcohol dehydrogenase
VKRGPAAVTGEGIELEQNGMKGKERPMKTRAAVLHEPRTPFVIETVELEPPRAGEVLIRMEAAGVCHSDWHLATGDTEHPMPVVAGHEGAGVVERTGEGVERLEPGDRVCLNWAPHCGSCFYCLNGRPGLCGDYTGPIWAGTLMDGTPRLSLGGKPLYHYSGLACFAERAVVPQESCVTLPAEVPFPVAALIGCAVTTGMGSVLNTARVEAGSSVVVLGAGGVGLSTVIGARLAGAGRILAVDRYETKEVMARKAGATGFLVNGPGLDGEIRNRTDGRGADYVFETTGIPEVQEQSLYLARPGGVIVLSGLAPMRSTTRLPGALITRQEKTVMGSYYGTSHTARDFPLYADLHVKGRIDLQALITRTYALEEINEAYRDMLDGRLARGVIRFER